MLTQEKSSSVNVHLYPSDFLHESRIEKIAQTLKQGCFFNQVWLVGILNRDLPRREEVEPGISLFRVGNSTQGLSFFRKLIAFTIYYVAVIKLIRSDNITCVNAHSLSVLPLAVFIKFTKKCILIYDTHELETETHSLRGARKRFAKIVENIFIRRIDAIFCVSDKISDWYATTYDIPAPVTILNAPDISTEIASNFLRDKFGLDANQNIYLYLGVLGSGRSIDILIEAFCAFEDSNNIMVFVGYGPMVAEIENCLGYGRTVLYLPAVPKHQIPLVAASADVGICMVSGKSLSYEYCMPNKLFEYLMSGLPVVVSPAITLREFVDKFEVGFVLHEITAPELMREIRRLSEMDLTAMKTNARNVALEFSWPKQQDKLRFSYLKLLSSRGCD